jgi:hypothetical protein
MKNLVLLLTLLCSIVGNAHAGGNLFQGLLGGDGGSSSAEGDRIVSGTESVVANSVNDQIQVNIQGTTTAYFYEGGLALTGALGEPGYPNLYLTNNDNTLTANQDLSTIYLNGLDSTGSEVSFASIGAIAVTSNSASPQSRMVLTADVVSASKVLSATALNARNISASFAYLGSCTGPGCGSGAATTANFLETTLTSQTISGTGLKIISTTVAPTISSSAAFGNYISLTTSRFQPTNGVSKTYEVTFGLSINPFSVAATGAQVYLVLRKNGSTQVCQRSVLISFQALFSIECTAKVVLNGTTDYLEALLNPQIGFLNGVLISTNVGSSNYSIKQLD